MLERWVFEIHSLQARIPSVLSSPVQDGGGHDRAILSVKRLGNPRPPCCRIELVRAASWHCSGPVLIAIQPRPSRRTSVFQVGDMQPHVPAREWNRRTPAHLAGALGQRLQTVPGTLQPCKLPGIIRDVPAGIADGHVRGGVARRPSIGLPRPRRLQHESAARIVLGAFVVFLLPGMALGELLKLRSCHPLETIAVSFVLSLFIEILLLPPVVACQAGIHVWVETLGSPSPPCCSLGWQCVVRLPAGAIPSPADSIAARIVDRPGRLGGDHQRAAGLAVLAYCWGEDPLDLGGEKMLHMMFIRYYSDMPLVFGDLGIDRGLPPPNLINLWEILIAGWARLVHLDPYACSVVPGWWCRCWGSRECICWSKRFLPSARKATAVFLAVLLMCCSGSSSCFLPRWPGLRPAIRRAA